MYTVFHKYDKCIKLHGVQNLCPPPPSRAKSRQASVKLTISLSTHFYRQLHYSSQPGVANGFWEKIFTRFSEN